MFGEMLKLFESNTFLEEALNSSKKMHKKTMSMIDDSWTAVLKKDKKLAQSVIERDDEIDELDVEIRKKVMTYLASMPTGGNVELALILIDVATALERIADHAQWIAEIAVHNPSLGKDKYTEKLAEMHRLAMGVGEATRTALGDTDEKKAKQVITNAATLKRIHMEIIHGLEADKKMPAQKAVAIWAVAANFGRMGGYAKNIALTVTGPYAEAK